VGLLVHSGGRRSALVVQLLSNIIDSLYQSEINVVRDDSLMKVVAVK
jgi:hypothetical protein